MKKFIALLLLLTLSCSTRVFAHDNDTKLFLNQFKHFVIDVEDTEPHDMTVKGKAIDSTYRNYVQRYKTIYREEMNGTQIQTFATYKARYLKKTKSHKIMRATQRLGEKTESTAAKVAGKMDTLTEKLQRKGSEVIGTVKGLFQNKKEEKKKV